MYKGKFYIIVCNPFCKYLEKSNGNYINSNYIIRKKFFKIFYNLYLKIKIDKISLFFRWSLKFKKESYILKNYFNKIILF